MKKRNVRKKLEYLLADTDVESNTNLYLEKFTCIEDMKVEYELGIEREGVGFAKERFLPSSINAIVGKLNNYGLNYSEFTLKTIVQSIKDTVNELETQYYHKDLGWGVVNGEIVFKSNKIVGSEIESSFRDENYSIKRKGEINTWVNGMNKLILTNENLELILVYGFISILVSIINKNLYIGNYLFNCYGGMNFERDLLINILKSIWTEPVTKEDIVYKVDNGKVNKLVESLSCETGYSILIKELDNKSVVNLANTILSSSLNSTVILNTDQSILDNNNVFNRENINEVDLDSIDVEEFQKNSREIEKIVKNNYGIAGEKFVEFLLELGIGNILEEFEKIKEKIEIEPEIVEVMNTRKLNEEKIAVILLTAKYLKKALGLDIETKRLKNTLLQFELENEVEVRKYSKALRSIYDYYERNKSKFVLKGDDIKSNTEGFLGTDIDGNIEKLIIPRPVFNNIIESLGYNSLRTLRTWKKKMLIETENESRYDKKITNWTANPRCIVILVKEGVNNDY